MLSKKSNSALAALIALAIIAGPALTAPTALAHHSYVSKYDPKNKVRVRGRITNVQYRNPHIFFQLETASGLLTVETESIQILTRKGLPRAKLKEGRSAVVTGWTARSGSGDIGLSTIQIKGVGSFSIRRSPR